MEMDLWDQPDRLAKLRDVTLAFEEVCAIVTR